MNFEGTQTGYSNNQNTWCRMMASKAGLGRDFLVPRQESKGSTGHRKGVLLRARAEPDKFMGDESSTEKEGADLPFQREKLLVPDSVCAEGGWFFAFVTECVIEVF